MCLNFEKDHMLSECDSLHIIVFFFLDRFYRIPPRFCITKEFKSQESLYMWFRLDFEAFLARMSQLENKHVMFIFSMCFDLVLHERSGF